MLVYIINSVLILIWAALFCWYKPSKKKNLIFIILAFSQILFLTVVRARIGNDYDMYAGGFYQMGRTGFEEMSYKDWEIGFVFLTKLMTFLVPNHIVYFGVLAVICVVPAAIYIYCNSKMPWLSTIMYINMFLFFMEMNFVRQAIALSFVMWAWHFLKNNKFIPFAIVIVLASLFHQTVLIMLPVYLWIKMKPGIKQLLAYGYLLLCFYIASEGIFDLITKFFHEEYNNSVFIKTGVSAVYCIFPVIVAIVGFVLYKTGTIKPTKENRYLVNLGLLNAFIMITMSRHAILERLSYYTLLFVILLAALIVSSLKENGIDVKWGEKSLVLVSNRQKTVLAVSVCAVFLLISSAVFVYGMMHSAHGVIPYNSLIPQLNMI